MTTNLRAKLAPAAGLGLLLVGPPLLLWSLVGWPLPTGYALREAIDLRWVSPTLARQLGATVAWAAWSYIAACIAASVFGQARHSTIALPLPHTFAGWINATVALLLVSSSVAGRHAAAPISPPVAAVSFDASAATQHANTPSSATKAYEVQPRDTLWDIAERHLGNALRWREIWQLNARQPMADGTTFTDPNLIRPGWQLTLPDAHPAGTEHVQPGNPVQPKPMHIPSASAPTPSTPDTAAPIAQIPHPAQEPSTIPQQQGGDQGTPAAESEHGAGLPLGLGLGAAAVGAIATLARRRRRAMRRRPVGLRLPLPTGELAAAERALRNSANQDAALAIAGTLRLAAALTPADAVPVLELVINTGDGIELQFSGRTELPEPFVATETGYRLPREHLAATYAAADRADPAPALVHLGDDQRGALYLNLEALGTVALDGEPDASDELIGRILTSLSGSPWSSLTEVRVTDERHAVADPLGVATLVTMTEELPRLTALAHHTRSEVLRSAAASLPSLRWCGGEAPDGISLVVTDPQVPELEALLALARDPATGVVAVLIGPHSDVPTIKLTDDSLLLPDLNIVTAPVIAPACAEVVRELLDLAEAPFVDVTTEPYGEVHEQAPPSGQDAEIVVRVLGPLDVDGPIPHLTPQLRDIVVYLALHRRGVSLGTMATALWPEALRSEKTLRNRMHELRRSLGGRISLGPGWRVDDTVTTDWAKFQAWAKGDLDDRQRALELVRGQPLQDVKGDWSSLEGFESEMEAAVVDLAITVSQELLAAGDPTAARAAVRAGLRACPWEERLYQLGMRSAADRGSIGEVKTLYNELRGILFEDDAEPDPETEATYREMIELARREAQVAGRQ
jgi:DNA-binding SARP family transcriptional activator